MYRRVREEGRYLPAYRDAPDYRTFDGFSMHFEHPHFRPEELESLQRGFYRTAFEELGPSLIRALQSWFEGYQNLKNSPIPMLRLRAERMRGYVRDALPGIYPAIRFGPNRERRAEARAFLRDIAREIGPLSFQDRLKCLGTVPLSFWTWVTEKLDLFQQPRLLRIEHRLG